MHPLDRSAIATIAAWMKRYAEIRATSDDDTRWPNAPMAVTSGISLSSDDPNCPAVMRRAYAWFVDYQTWLERWDQRPAPEPMVI